MLATIPIDLIENGQRLRDISEAQVEALVNSIGDVGLLNPITVYRRQLYRGGNQVDGFGLVAGLHRKTACERLGLVEIEANILELDDLNRQIAECDENLCAPQLSPSDRARFTKRRKEAYEALHPETKNGRNQHSDRDGQVVQPSFASDQAAATGVDERTVRRDAERGEKVADKALDLIKNTKLDTGKYLDTLKALPVTEQIKRAKADLAKPAVVRKNPSRIADRPLDDAAALENQVAALVSAWNKASAEAREDFIGRIDLTPYIPDPANRAAPGQAAADPGMDAAAQPLVPEAPEDATDRSLSGDPFTEAPTPLPVDQGQRAAASITQEQRPAEAKTSEQEPSEAEGSGGVQDRCESTPPPITREGAPADGEEEAPSSPPSVPTPIPTEAERIMARAIAKNPRRPHCLKPDTCGSSDPRAHCFTCQKAHADAEGIAA